MVRLGFISCSFELHTWFISYENFRGCIKVTFGVDSRTVYLTAILEVVDLCRNAAIAALGEQMHLDETTVMGKHFEKALLHLRRDTSQEVLALFDAFEEGSRKI